MEKLLTSKEREKLIQRHRKERDGRIRDRIKAVLAYDDGYSYSEIARILLLDDETIRRHIDDYQREQKLKPANGGSDSNLTDKESRELIEHLKEVTYLYVKDICQYVRETYRKKYSISGMTKWLHAHNFCYKKAHGVPAKADREKQKTFIQYYIRLKKKAGKEEPIYFADSVHPQHQTQLTYGWIEKGERKEIATTGQQKRLNFIGGITLNGHRFIYHQADKINADSICDFLWKLRKANPGKFYVHVILDNAGPHKDDEVYAFAKELGIKLHYLPPYSPNLNPVERIWKLMHENIRYNKYYSRFSEFTDATLGFFKSIGRKKNILRERITSL
jgi:transposase